MKKFLFLSIITLILFSSSVSKFLSKSFFDTKLKQSTKDIQKVSNAILKKFLKNKDFYIIDTREMTIIAKGYISNCILLPTSLFSWMPSVVPDNANVIIITDEENKEATLKKVIDLNKYKIYGYGIYNEFVKVSFFNIEKIEYNQNTKSSIQYIVQTGGNIIDIREKNEYEETGVIKSAKLIPLSTFQKDVSKIPNNGNVYVYCKSGMRAVIGMSYAKRAGFTNNFIIMQGGMNKAIQEGYPLVPYSG